MDQALQRALKVTETMKKSSQMRISVATRMTMSTTTLRTQRIVRASVNEVRWRAGHAGEQGEAEDRAKAEDEAEDSAKAEDEAEPVEPALNEVGVAAEGAEAIHQTVVRDVDADVVL